MIDEQGRFIVKTTNEPDEKFNCVAYFTDGVWKFMAEGVSTEDAFESFRTTVAIADRPIGFVYERILITDQKTDSVCAEWQRGKGIVFPTREDCAKMAAGST
jgi:hypothetical protein